MSDFGVTSAGFILKRLEDIAQQMRANAQIALPGIDTTPDSVPGTMIDVIADAEAEQWQLAQETYNARFPATAEGAQLDFIGQFNAIKRGGPIKSFVQEGFQGVNGTIIPAGTQVRSDRDDVYQTLIEATLNNTTTNKVILQVANVQDAHTYTIFIDSNSVDYLSDADATIEEITTGIVAAINAQTGILLVNANEIDVGAGTFDIISNNGERAFEASFTADFTLTEFWTPIKITALEAGPLEAEAGTIATIVTPVADLASVTNFTEVTIGRVIQDNEDYRLSLYQEVRRLGGGSLEAIKDRLLNNVEDVLLVKAFENDTMVIDAELRPAKSIEILIEGGADQDIAEELWIAKGGGIETYGDESALITDSQGDERLIKFSRPTPAYIWFKITITTNAQFPSDGENAIKDGVVLTGRNNFSIGDEILIQQFYCPIYDVNGVETALIEIAKTSDLTPPVAYVTTNITLLDVESPLFDASRVQVIIS